MPAAPVRPLDAINGVLIADIRAFPDSRGAFMESFRREWFPDTSFERMQGNCSISRAGVLRGLHFHRRQADYWFVASGAIRVGLADLRASSPTFKRSASIELSADNHLGLLIPAGVAHGLLAITDVILTYLVNNYYDVNDELGVAWNDPDLNVPWVEVPQIISERDASNPRFSDLPAELLPQ
jgi:dTDP-4-dehydrorhamnose 3,5-epimerase